MAHISFCFSDDDNISCGSVHAIKENREALIVTRREIALEENVDKIKYVVMSRERAVCKTRSKYQDL